jgi:hypothetical protein
MHVMSKITYTFNTSGVKYTPDQIEDFKTDNER